MQTLGWKHFWIAALLIVGEVLNLLVRIILPGWAFVHGLVSYSLGDKEALLFLSLFLVIHMCVSRQFCAALDERVIRPAAKALRKCGSLPSAKPMSCGR